MRITWGEETQLSNCPLWIILGVWRQAFSGLLIDAGGPKLFRGLKIRNGSKMSDADL